MKYHFSIGEYKFTFNSYEEAENMLTGLRVRQTSDMYFDVIVERTFPLLNGMKIDDASIYAAEMMWGKDMKVPAIKFLRMLAKGGLKETKDWCDANLMARQY